MRRLAEADSAFIAAMGRAPMVKTSRRMPPTPGRRALVGLDVGGVVVALHLEDERLAVAEVHHARVLARPADHLRPLGGQRPQPPLRRLVGAVLVPHGREDAELGERRRPAEEPQEPSYSSGLMPWAATRSGVISGSSMPLPLRYRGGAAKRRLGKFLRLKARSCRQIPVEIVGRVRPRRLLRPAKPISKRRPPLCLGRKGGGTRTNRRCGRRKSGAALHRNPGCENVANRNDFGILNSAIERRLLNGAKTFRSCVD